MSLKGGEIWQKNLDAKQLTAAIRLKPRTGDQTNLFREEFMKRSHRRINSTTD
jgi:hypothetical protein